MSKQASSITSTNSDSNALNGFKKRQCHLICKWLPFSSFHHQFLESFHKYLRFCDLCKELAFGSPDALRQNQDFIQLVRAQNVLPPVPGEAEHVAGLGGGSDFSAERLDDAADPRDHRRIAGREHTAGEIDAVLESCPRDRHGHAQI